MDVNSTEFVETRKLTPCKTILEDKTVFVKIKLILKQLKIITE
jgi:hypothetical protein